MSHRALLIERDCASRSIHGDREHQRVRASSAPFHHAACRQRQDHCLTGRRVDETRWTSCHTKGEHQGIDRRRAIIAEGNREACGKAALRIRRKLGFVHLKGRRRSGNRHRRDIIIGPRGNRDHFLIKLHTKGQLGVRKQIAEIERVLDSARIDREVATRTGIDTRCRLGLVADQQRRHVGGRDRNALHNDLRDEDGTVRNDDPRSIRQHNDQIAALREQGIDGLPFGQDNHVTRIGLQGLRHLLLHLLHHGERRSGNRKNGRSASTRQLTLNSVHILSHRHPSATRRVRTGYVVFKKCLNTTC